jgi:predicted nucleic acid-binding protein
MPTPSVTANARILVDTSIWIGYFQDRLPAPAAVRFEEVLDLGDIHVPKVVLAELIQGARSEKEIIAIRRFSGAFRIVEEGPETWLKSGRLAYDLRRKGLTVHLTDCYIATIAMEKGCALFTLDRHFGEIARVTGLPLL